MSKAMITIHGNEWERDYIEEQAACYAQFDTWEHKTFVTIDSWGLRTPDGRIVVVSQNPDIEALKASLARNGDELPFDAPDLEAGEWVKLAGAWDHEHCEICFWTIDEFDGPESSRMGWECKEAKEAWLCEECYEKLVKPRLDAKRT